MDTFLAILGFGSLAIMATALIGDLVFDPEPHKWATAAFILALFTALGIGAHLS